jgi:hypothetical protein
VRTALPKLVDTLAVVDKWWVTRLRTEGARAVDGLKLLKRCFETAKASGHYGRQRSGINS